MKWPRSSSSIAEVQALAAKIFRMDDCTWWAAETLDAAIADYTRETGQTREEALAEEPYELSAEQLDQTMFDDDGEKRTFRAELARRVAAGEQFPQMFACTEY